MICKRSAAGFTLIEILIVVVILAVLAGTMIPQFSTSTADSREGSLKQNLQALRTQIELYKLYHLGTPPDGTNNLKQLTSATDVSGALSPTGLVDPTHPIASCVRDSLPTQAFSGLISVKLDTGAAGTLPTATTGPAADGSIGRRLDKSGSTIPIISTFSNARLRGSAAAHKVEIVAVFRRTSGPRSSVPAPPQCAPATASS
jgi:general secretion pathway protein G